MTTPPSSSTPHERPAGSAAAGREGSGQDAAQRVFRRALRDVVVFLLALGVLGCVVGVIFWGTAGLWGALLGMVVALFFSGTTVVVMLKTAHSSPTTTGAVVMGSWLVKMIFLIIVLIVLRDMDFFNEYVFGGVLLIGCIGSALLDYWAVTRGRVPYVDSESR